MEAAFHYEVEYYVLNNANIQYLTLSAIPPEKQMTSNRPSQIYVVTHTNKPTHTDTHKQRHSLRPIQTVRQTVEKSAKHSQTIIHTNTYSPSHRISLSNTSTHKHKNNDTNNLK